MKTVVTTALLAALAGVAAAQGPAASAAAMTPAQAQMRAGMAKGYQLKAEHKPGAAIEAFKTVLRSDPGNSEALVEIGYLHASLKQWAGAARYLRLASQQDPGNMRLKMDLGYALASADDGAGAAEQFRAVAAEPGEFSQKASEALAAMGAGAESQARSGHRKLINDGWAALRRGDRPGARRQFEEALKEDPRDAGVLKQVGFLDLHDGRMEEAVSRFETARSLDAQDRFIALQLGYLYQRLGRKEPAREAFLSARQSPDEKIRSAAEAALKVPGTPAETPAETPAAPAR